MRKVTLGLANSLDSFIAREDGRSDWLHWSDEVAEISAKFMKTVDVLVMGRKTYEVMLASGETSYPGATNYVFTRSAKKAVALRKRLAQEGGQECRDSVGKRCRICEKAENQKRQGHRRVRRRRAGK